MVFVLHDPLLVSTTGKIIGIPGTVAAAVAALCLASPGWTRASEPAQPSASELIKKSIRALRTEQEIATYSMHLIGPSGEEGRRTMKVWFKSPNVDEAKLLIKFSEPASIRGTGILTLVEKGKSPDQWLFIPTYGKVRRISHGNENESFLGSDFTMADLDVRRGESYDFSVSGSQKCGPVDCFVLVGLPKASEARDEQIYSRKIVFIRKDNFLNVRTELYNAADQLEKVMELQGIHRDASNRWAAERMEMQTLPTHHKTVLEFEKRDRGTVPEDYLFTQSFLERS